MDIRQNDTVEVRTGKDRGKRGRVRSVLSHQQRAFVEGVNVVKRHQKAMPPVRQAGIIEKEASVHLSNLMLVCSSCSKATRVGHTILSDGRKVRVCRRCGNTTG